MRFKKEVEFIGAVIVGWVAISAVLLVMAAVLAAGCWVFVIISYAKLHIVVRTILLVLAGSFMISLIAGIYVFFIEGEL